VSHVFCLIGNFKISDFRLIGSTFTTVYPLRRRPWFVCLFLSVCKDRPIRTKRTKSQKKKFDKYIENFRKPKYKFFLNRFLGQNIHGVLQMFSEKIKSKIRSKNYICRKMFVCHFEVSIRNYKKCGFKELYPLFVIPYNRTPGVPPLDLYFGSLSLYVS